MQPSSLATLRTLQAGVTLPSCPRNTSLLRCNPPFPAELISQPLGPGLLTRQELLQGRFGLLPTGTNLNALLAQVDRFPAPQPPPSPPAASITTGCQWQKPPPLKPVPPCAATQLASGRDKANCIFAAALPTLQAPVAAVEASPPQRPSAQGSATPWAVPQRRRCTRCI